MPIYSDVELKLVAVVRVDQVYGDYQSRAFFRIGVLPMVVLDGLRLELCDTNQIPVALSQISIRVGTKGKASNAIEGRDFSLSFTGQTNGIIHAKTVRLENGTQWLLQKGTIDQPGVTSISFRRATLTTTGPESGELACETTAGTVRVHLLSLVAGKDHDSTKP